MDLWDEFLILPLLLGSSLASGLILQLFRYKDQFGAKNLIFTLTFGILWAFLYALELAEEDIPEKMFWAKTQYLCVAGVVPSWFLYVWNYTLSRGNLMNYRTNPWLAVGVCIIPVAIQPFVWTNDRHGLIWPSVEANQHGELLILKFNHGPLYYLINGYSLLILTIGSLLLLRLVITERSMFPGHRILIFLSTILPLVGNVIYGLKFDWLHGVDPTPFAIILATCFLASAVIRYDGVDLASVARKKALDLLPHSILVLKNNHTLLDLNEAGIMLLNHPRHAVVGKDLDAVLITTPPLKAVLNQTETSTPQEIRMQHHDNTEHILRLYAAELGSAHEIHQGKVILLEDVTHERVIEEALRESEAQFRSLVSNIPGVVYNSSGWPHDSMSYLSEFVEEITGYNANEFAPTGSMTFSSIIHPEDRRALQSNAIGETVRPGRSNLEYRLVHKDGSIRWVLDRSESRNKNDGNKGWLEGLILDITQRKESEDLVREASEEAQAANRAKSEFLANMSHEIRTPMNGILGMTQVMLSHGLSDDQQKRAEIILRSGENLLTILNDILDLSKIESGKFDLDERPFNVHELANEADGLFRKLAEEQGLTFTVRIDPNLPTNYLGDPIRVSQIIHNMLSNAVKFTHTGSITLALTQEPHPQAGSALRLSVQDTGIGMNPEQISRVQHAFEQADASTTRNYGGTGLGMTIIAHLSDLMSGSLHLESKEGIGTTVEVLLPLAIHHGDPAPAYPTQAKPTLWDGPPLNAHILIVDDNAYNLEVAVGLIGPMVSHIDVVDNGAEAVQRAEFARYDAIFMDVQMPSMNGYVTTSRIRQLKDYETVPIIAMTASAMSEDRQQCMNAGMDDFLAKPLRQSELSAVVRRWILADDAPADTNSDLVPTSPEPTTSEIFDANYMERELGFDTVTAEQARKNFNNALRTCLDQYLEACKAQDNEAAVLAIHSLRSAASYLGGSRVIPLTVRIETCHKNNDPETANTLHADLVSETEILRAAVQEFLENSGDRS